MKTSNLFTLVAILILPGLKTTGNAQDLLSARVSTRCVMTNQTGGLSHSRYGNREIINQAADAAGITNRMGLRLVYNRTNDDLEVVMGTNHTVVATPITFSDAVSLSKTNGRVTERLAWVFLGTNAAPSGTLRATENSSFGTSNQLTHFSFHGQVQFAVSASTNEAAAIYAGSIFAGPMRSRGHDDNEDDHDDGD
jgi:hypothetical protein